MRSARQLTSSARRRSTASSSSRDSTASSAPAAPSTVAVPAVSAGAASSSIHSPSDECYVFIDDGSIGSFELRRGERTRPRSSEEPAPRTTRYSPTEGRAASPRGSRAAPAPRGRGATCAVSMDMLFLRTSSIFGSWTCESHNVVSANVLLVRNASSPVGGRRPGAAPALSHRPIYHRYLQHFSKAGSARSERSRRSRVRIPVEH